LQQEKEKFYRTKWFLWACLILFPPVGIILLWIYHSGMKQNTKIILSVIFAFWFGISLGSTNTDSPTATVAETNKPETELVTTNEPDKVEENKEPLQVEKEPDKVEESKEPSQEDKPVKEKEVEVPQKAIVRAIEDTAAIETLILRGSIFEYDSVVNQLLLDYNKKAEYIIKATNVQKGNVKTKALIDIENLDIEVINASHNGFIHISIDLTNQEPTGSLYAVYRDFLYAIDDSLSDDEIGTAWADIQKERYSIIYPDSSSYNEKSYELNDIQLTHSDTNLYGRKIRVQILYKIE